MPWICHKTLNKLFSLLSCVGKVFELVIFKYIYNSLIELIYKYQSGFMHKDFTVYQLIEIYHNICLALDNHEIIFTFSLLKTIQCLLAAWLVEKIIHSVFFGLK
jgi:hypothetical protein